MRGFGTTEIAKGWAATRPTHVKIDAPMREWTDETRDGLVCGELAENRVSNWQRSEFDPTHMKEPRTSMSSDGDCPICYDQMFARTSETIRPCGHAFCSACLRQSFSKKLECPLCRSVPIASPGQFVVTGRVLLCHVSADCPPGITLTNDGPSVRVVRVQKNDAAARGGLKRNDRIVSINALPCRSHQETIRVWQAILEHSKMMNAALVVRCEISRPSFLWRW